jgi:hypothetical protein
LDQDAFRVNAKPTRASPTEKTGKLTKRTGYAGKSWKRY